MAVLNKAVLKSYVLLSAVLLHSLFRAVPKDDSGDGKVATLRAVLHAVERSGMVEITLGGHSCSRPPDVKQGRCDDYFNVAPEGDELLWRPNTVQAKSLKSTNLASHFTFTQLHGSSLRLAHRFH